MKKDRLILTATIGLLCAILVVSFIWKFVIAHPNTLIRQDVQGQFRLFVKGRPFFIKGVVYNPVPIGQNHQYNFWGDPNQPWLVDGQLMKAMGANTVRFFQPGDNPEQTKTMIGSLYQNQRIYSIIGHWMDYWRPGNYADANYRKDLTQRVLDMVTTYKDEKGVLIWVLGNENNLSWHAGARVPWSCPEADEIQDPYKREMAKARIYYSLVNEIAGEIKKIDPDHLVALGNADVYGLEVAAEICPDIDLIAITAYRGKNFGNLWRDVKSKIDKPVMIMEFGCDSFDAKEKVEDQDIQASFIKSQWQDIADNAYGAGCVGSALGGCIFEWNDEWWKHNEVMPTSWYMHDTEGDWSAGGYYYDIGASGNMNINEEWWGIVALSPQLENGINKRLPRKVYYQLQEIWRRR